MDENSTLTQDELKNLVKEEKEINEMNLICPQCKSKILIKIDPTDMTCIYECSNGHILNKSELLTYNDCPNPKGFDTIGAKLETQKNDEGRRRSILLLDFPFANSQLNKDKKDDFHCPYHKEKFLSYCVDCCKDLCMICLGDHENHDVKHYTSIMPKKKDINMEKQIIQYQKKKVEQLSSLINEILEKLKKETKHLINRLKDRLEENEIQLDKFNFHSLNYDTISIINNLPNELNEKISMFLFLEKSSTLHKKVMLLLGLLNLDKKELMHHVEFNINKMRDSMKYIINDTNKYCDETSGTESVKDSNITFGKKMKGYFNDKMVGNVDMKRRKNSLMARNYQAKINNKDYKNSKKKSLKEEIRNQRDLSMDNKKIDTKKVSAKKNYEFQDEDDVQIKPDYTSAKDAIKKLRFNTDRKLFNDINNKNKNKNNDSYYNNDDNDNIYDSIDENGKKKRQILEKTKNSNYVGKLNKTDHKYNNVHMIKEIDEKLKKPKNLIEKNYEVLDTEEKYEIIEKEIEIENGEKKEEIKSKKIFCKKNIGGSNPFNISISDKPKNDSNYNPYVTYNNSFEGDYGSLIKFNESETKSNKIDDDKINNNKNLDKNDVKKTNSDEIVSRKKNKNEEICIINEEGSSDKKKKNGIEEYYKMTANKNKNNKNNKYRYSSNTFDYYYNNSDLNKLKDVSTKDENMEQRINKNKNKNLNNDNIANLTYDYSESNKKNSQQTFESINNSNNANNKENNNYKSIRNASEKHKTPSDNKKIPKNTSNKQKQSTTTKKNANNFTKNTNLNTKEDSDSLNNTSTNTLSNSNKLNKNNSIKEEEIKKQKQTKTSKINNKAKPKLPEDNNKLVNKSQMTTDSVIGNEKTIIINESDANKKVFALCEMKKKNILCVGERRGSISLYDTSTFFLIFTIEGKHNKDILHLYELSDGKLLSCGKDCKINIFQFTNYHKDSKKKIDGFILIQTITEKEGLNGRIFNCIELNNKFLVSADSKNVIIWKPNKNNINTYQFYYTISISKNTYSVLELNSETFALYIQGGIIKFYNSKTFEEIQKITLNLGAPLNSKTFRENLSKLNNEVFVADGNDCLFLISISKMELIKEIYFNDYNYLHSFCSMNDNERILVACSKNKNEYVCTELLQYQINDKNDDLVLTSIIQSENEKRKLLSVLAIEKGGIVTGSDDGTIKVWK